MDPREADRRHDDRRRSDRRGGNAEARGGRRRDDDSGSSESGFDPAWLSTAGELPSDSRLLERRERRQARARDNAFVRVYRTYAAARAVVGVGLVGAHAASSLVGTRAPEWLVLVSIAYAVQAITLWLLPRFGALARPQTQSQQRRRQWLATIGVDIAAFTVLHVLELGSSFNYAALLVLPVLMAGVLTSRLLALGTAAAMALMLLGLAAWRASTGVDSTGALLQSGLAGMGLFIITLLSGELAARLAREESAARGSLEFARQQAQLNRLVIEEMADGVLVIDRGLLVRAANPAARALLVDQGLGPPAPFMLDRAPAWRPLLEAAEQALREGRWPDAGQDVTLAFGQGHLRTLRVRVRFMRGGQMQGTESVPAALADANLNPEPAAVLLLEDLRTLQARIRQEKLAAMGRVSAGIAHEIRNPLAAIAQANALLMEDVTAPDQLRLAAMVADNVERLKRLVDDVMEVAPGAAPAPQAIDALAAVRRAVSEWAQTVGLPLGADSRLHTDIGAGPLDVVFDPEHLRRVVVNLLDNAHRHASAAPGSFVLRLWRRDDQTVMLSVASDGAPIAPEVERRLFEPFFSTRSRGSGLGLYICRELCERYGASIEYRPRVAADRLRNEFTVSLRSALLTGAATAALPLDMP
ncbi:MAG: histidine kinase [Rubrivivax sp.]|nr:histidine kinase [Rubrivivax sp.]